MFRFTIRDVLWLIVVVGLGVGWWVDHRRLTLWQDRAEYLAYFCEATIGWKVTWKEGRRDPDVVNDHSVPATPIELSNQKE